MLRPGEASEIKFCCPQPLSVAAHNSPPLLYSRGSRPIVTRPILRRELADIVAGLDDLGESHHFYPVLHDFRFAEPFYATGRILLVAMESTTLLQSALDENEYRLLVRSPAIGNLEFSGMHLISHISEVFLTRSRHPSGKPAETEIASWRERYRQVLQKLRADGVRVASDLEPGSARYALC